MLKKISNGCNYLVQRWLPDPYVFALLLTALVFFLGIFINHETPLGMIVHWGDGFWGFLGFSMQMVLVVVLGNCLANAPIFRKLLQNLAGIPKTPKQAVAFCTLISGIAYLIQWGFGLVVGAIFAKELAKRVRGVDYRLLVASAYSAYIITLTTNSSLIKLFNTPTLIHSNSKKTKETLYTRKIFCYTIQGTCKEHSPMLLRHFILLRYLPMAQLDSASDSDVSDNFG